MKKVNNFNLQKYINKLKIGKAPAYIIGQENGLGLKNIYHPAFDRTEIISKESQINEFYGKIDENHKYFSDEYHNLLDSLKKLDTQYKLSDSLASKIKLSKDQHAEWKIFIDSTSTNLPVDEYKIKDDILIKLKDIWMRFKKRNKDTIPAEEILPYHHEFTKYYKFDFPVHPKNLSMMLNPNWGYLCKFTKNEFSFEDLINFYKAEFVSTFFRNNGRDILANRVSAFNYWNIIDKEHRGFLSFREFVYLLESMAFDIDNLNPQSIHKEFATAFNFLENELLTNEKNNIYRFRLFEFLFMERCAIY